MACWSFWLLSSVLFFSRVAHVSCFLRLGGAPLVRLQLQQRRTRCIEFSATTERSAVDEGIRVAANGAGGGASKPVKGDVDITRAPATSDVSLNVGDKDGTIESSSTTDGSNAESGSKRLSPLTSGIFTDATLESLQRRVRLSDVVGRHVQLKPSGRDMLGLCPFHSENTPSFRVNDSKGLYHCFGCDAGGNVINFTMELEGMSFPEAVKSLAEEYNQPLEYVNGRSGSSNGEAGKEKRSRLAALLDCAADFYAKALIEAPTAGVARAHLFTRGIKAGTVLAFQLGYSAPNQQSPVIAHLIDKGYRQEEIVAAGIGVQVKGLCLDRFSGRLIVPIRNAKGSVIGFGGRDLTPPPVEIPVSPAKPANRASRKKAAAETAPANTTAIATPARPPAKYINSPESEIFHKGDNLFALDRARTAMREEDVAVIVEGYFDVIALHGAKVECVVGSLGTALSMDQLVLAAKQTRSRRVVLCMDADSAGKRAVYRLCERGSGASSNSILDALTEEGIEIRVADLPAGCKDPSDFIQQRGGDVHAGAAFRAEVVSVSKPWMVWYGDHILSQHDHRGDAAAFSACVTQLTAFLGRMSSTADRTFHAYRYAGALAGDNLALKLQLESDLVSEATRRQQRQGALRKRVESVVTEVDREVATLAGGGVLPLDDMSTMSKKSRTVGDSIRTASTLARQQQQQQGTTQKDSGKGGGMGAGRGGYGRKEPPLLVNGMQVVGPSEGKNLVAYGKGGGLVNGWKKNNKKEDLSGEWQHVDPKEFIPRPAVQFNRAVDFLLTLLLHDAEQRPKSLDIVCRSGFGGITSPTRLWLFNALMALEGDARSTPLSELRNTLALNAPHGYLSPSVKENESNIKSSSAKKGELDGLFEYTDMSKLAISKTPLGLQEALVQALRAVAVEEERAMRAELTAAMRDLYDAYKSSGVIRKDNVDTERQNASEYVVNGDGTDTSQSESADAIAKRSADSIDTVDSNASIDNVVINGEDKNSLSNISVELEVPVNGVSVDVEVGASPIEFQEDYTFIDAAKQKLAVCEARWRAAVTELMRLDERRQHLTEEVSRNLLKVTNLRTGYGGGGDAPKRDVEVDEDLAFVSENETEVEIAQMDMDASKSAEIERVQEFEGSRGLQPAQDEETRQKEAGYAADYDKCFAGRYTREDGG